MNQLAVQTIFININKKQRMLKILETEVTVYASA